MDGGEGEASVSGVSGVSGVGGGERGGSHKYDMVFIDADKKVYQEYLRDLMGEGGEGEGEGKGGESRSCLLNDGALVVVDNTLWKGLVLEHTEDLAQYAPEAHLYGNPDRLRALAQSMHEFNEWAAAHPRLHAVMLPLRDGLTVMRFRQGSSAVDSH